MTTPSLYPLFLMTAEGGGQTIVLGREVQLSVAAGHAELLVAPQNARLATHAQAVITAQRLQANLKAGRQRVELST